MSRQLRVTFETPLRSPRHLRNITPQYPSLRSASAPGDVVAPLAHLFRTAGATEASPRHFRDTSETLPRHRGR